MQDMHSYSMSGARRRESLADWMNHPDFTHAIHLAPNQASLSFHKMRDMFGRFCFQMDRYLLGVKHVHFRNSHGRLQMIAMPEKLGLNPHLHGVANFSPAYWGESLTLPWEWKLNEVWREVTRGSGSTVIQANPDRGAALYATKEAYRRDHEYLHSWDFHRDDKLRKRPHATSLHTIAPRKAVLHS